MIRCLNLGCGDNVKPSTEEVVWTNLDRTTREGVDAVGDLENGLPMFEDNHFDFVLASHVLEHVQNFLPLMREIHRILKPGGTLVAKVPEFPCRAAVADPTHVRFFVPETFTHFVKHCMGFDTGGLAGLFELLWLESTAHDRPQIDRGKIGQYFTEIHCELRKAAA
jgi:SAM-dependent methyltransferase